MFYVINLARRSDRKTDFIKKFESLEISDHYEFVEAVEEVKYEDSIILGKIKNKNPRMLATSLSHYKTWKLIAESDEPYGVVLEDDILFQYDFKKHWIKIKQKLKRCSETMELIYLGMGDCLPIHTKPPSLTLLKAQEKSHVLKGSVVNDLFGTPDQKSPYIFDWFGSFSYIITKQGANLLINLAETLKIDCSIDKWIQKSIISKKVSIPLLIYHPALTKNVYDSDIQITNKSLEIKNNKNEECSIKTAFLIVVEKSECYYLESTILSILRNAKYPNNVMFAFRIEYDDSISKTIIQNLRDGNYDSDGIMLKPSVCIIQGSYKPLNELHNEYNNLWRCYFRVADLFVCWDWDKKLISKEWDLTLLKYWRSYGYPEIACFQIESNVERNSNSLNDEYYDDHDIWYFSTPIMTKELLLSIDHISISPNINEYIKYVCYLSKITIIIKNIQSQRISDTRVMYDEKVIEDFYESSTTKYNIMKDINTIKKSPKYKECGMWFDLPNDWNSTKTIGESKLN